MLAITLCLLLGAGVFCCRSCLYRISVLRIVCLLGTVGTAESLPTNARAVRPSRWVSEEWRPLSESVAVELSSKSNINITNSSSAFSYI